MCPYPTQSVNECFVFKLSLDCVDSTRPYRLAMGKLTSYLYTLPLALHASGIPSLNLHKSWASVCDCAMTPSIIISSICFSKKELIFSKSCLILLPCVSIRA
eukprot:NODE_33_length_32023_cov_0.217579.p25 type:complete len:102 gc:universal NODE_33_length_32023_cov_0.217579:12355-12050(-)